MRHCDGGSSLASCCEPMQRAKKSVRSLLKEKPWLRCRSLERERERVCVYVLSFVWQFCEMFGNL